MSMTRTLTFDEKEWAAFAEVMAYLKHAREQHFADAMVSRRAQRMIRSLLESTERLHKPSVEPQHVQLPSTGGEW